MGAVVMREKWNLWFGEESARLPCTDTPATELEPWMGLPTQHPHRWPEGRLVQSTLSQVTL